MHHRLGGLHRAKLFRVSVRCQAAEHGLQETRGSWPVREIADQLPLPDRGRLLNIGTGSGLQLRVIHERCPNLGLFGLDLSAASIAVAQRNLKGINVDLRVGSIDQTPYDDGFSDVVTCNASMSYTCSIRCSAFIEKRLQAPRHIVAAYPEAHYIW